MFTPFFRWQSRCTMTKIAYFCCTMSALKNHIVIIGAGNVGTHLALLFKENGAEVTIACRNSASAAHLSAKGITVVSVSEMTIDAGLYLLCLKDSVIPEVAAVLPDLKGIVAHTSGSLGQEPLSNCSNKGVFYPFQSFRKEIPLTVKDFPILIEASDAATESVLMHFASMISSSAMVVPANVRAGIHAGGVFVSNFTNLMYNAGWQVAQEKGFDANKLLCPLIEETALRLKYKHPSELQTGPAIRNDRETVSKHLEILKENPELFILYKELTNVLLKKYGHEELS